MYAVISPEKIEITPGSVFKIPGNWSDYFPNIDVLNLISDCFQTAKERNTSTAIRQLRFLVKRELKIKSC